MSQILLEKARILGISEEDIQGMTEKQLANEVRYASLSSTARNDLERGQVSSIGFNRAHLPDAMVVRRVAV